MCLILSFLFPINSFLLTKDNLLKSFFLYALSKIPLVYSLLIINPSALFVIKISSDIFFISFAQIF